ncbi:type III secretion system protein, YscR/HrcR family [Desulfosarcina variabilis str. Montpellier]|uniref:type III secretion system export apparatus subunit SctR n=1 Tax=Desulfosarcina variabilis TaxID=2300 RepID=UPI003AFAED62
MFSANSFDPVYITIVLLGLGLAPFAALMVTSFIKISIVLELVRNALGLQQVPPNMVIHGLALILTFYIMAPVGQDMFNIVTDALKKEENFQELMKEVVKAKEPLREFLMRHSNAKERLFFVQSSIKLWKNEEAKNLKEDDLIVLVPAFTVNELTRAFKIGFLIYLPFVIIDLIVSNILLAMGMIMVSPIMISVPFKLLLFVLLDGWTKLIHGLVLSFQ